MALAKVTWVVPFTSPFGLFEKEVEAGSLAEAIFAAVADLPAIPALANALPVTANSRPKSIPKGH